MESAALSIPILTLSKTLKLNPNPLFYRHFSKSSLQARLFSFSRTTCISPPDFHNFRDRFLISFAASFLQKLPASVPVSSRLACISSSARTEVVSGGDGNGPSGGNGSGGGDGGSDSGGLEEKSLAGESEDVSVLLPDVIILDVGGMTCGGCAASVKRILESQPQVSSASVNLATETAVVWATPEVKATQNWQQQLGERLAQHLTNCGFKSNVRGQSFTGKCGKRKHANSYMIQWPRSCNVPIVDGGVLEISKIRRSISSKFSVAMTWFSIKKKKNGCLGFSILGDVGTFSICFEAHHFYGTRGSMNCTSYCHAGLLNVHAFQELIYRQYLVDLDFTAFNVGSQILCHESYKVMSIHRCLAAAGINGFGQEHFYQMGVHLLE